jgi:toxin-antitoxin system PIN domain toxin
LSFLLDTNVLIYAFSVQRPEHRETRDWLESLAGLPGGLALASSAVTGFLRIVTNRRIFDDPATIGESLDFVDGLRVTPGARSIEPGAEHSDLFAGLCRSLDLRGDDVPDAHLAALAIEHGAVLATHDRGFDRFPGLRTFDPLA